MPCLLQKPAGALLLAALTTSIGALTPTDARGAPSAAQVDAARRLFVQAEADEDGGHWAEALDKLKSVAEFKLTAGVRYHIALCEEHLGRLSRALADYVAANSEAHAEKARDVLRLVGKQLSALDRRVPRLTVHLLPDLAEAMVTVDGEPVARALLATPMAVDPGVHRVVAGAPDRPPSEVTVTLQEHDSMVLEVRLGEPSAAGAAPESPSAATGPGVTSANEAAPGASAGAAAGPTAPGSPTADGGAAAEGRAGVAGGVAEISAEGASRGASSPPSTSRGGSYLGATWATALTAALAAGGAVAYVVAGNEHERAVSSCAHEVSSCDALRDRIRVWDFAAAGAWTAAIVSGAVAVALWVSPRHGESAIRVRLQLGAARIALGGTF